MIDRPWIWLGTVLVALLMASSMIGCNDGGFSGSSEKANKNQEAERVKPKSGPIEKAEREVDREPEYESQDIKASDPTQPAKQVQELPPPPPEILMEDEDVEVEPSNQPLPPEPEDSPDAFPERCKGTYYGMNTCSLINGFYRFTFDEQQISGGPLYLGFTKKVHDCETEFNLDQNKDDFYEFKKTKNDCTYPVPEYVSFRCGDVGKSVTQKSRMGIMRCEFILVPQETAEEQGLAVDETAYKNKEWCSKFKCK